MAKKSPLTLKEQQRLKGLLEVISGDGDEVDSKTERQEEGEEANGCIDDKEVQRFVDLGLGRGIDATNLTPWQNKTSIQIRPATFENILGTEESGSIQSYEKMLTRVSEMHWKVTASEMANPNTAAPLAIGVEESYTRSSSSRKYIVGTKVLNRTICFKDTCDDSRIQLQPGSLMFEAWLCRWILKNFVKDSGRAVDVEDKIDTLKQELTVLNEEYEVLKCDFTELKSKHEAFESDNDIESIKTELQDLEHKKKLNKIEMEKMENKKKWFLNTLEKEYKKTGQTDEKQYKAEEFDQDFKYQEIKVSKEGDEIDGRITLLTEQCGKEMNKLKELERRLEATKTALDKREASLKEKNDDLKRTQSHKFSIDEFRKRLDTPELQCKKLTTYCSQFLTQFRVTHYVSSIQLGASGYKVVTKSKAAKSQKVRNSVRVDKIAAGEVRRSSSKFRIQRRGGAVNKIGVIEMEANKAVVKRRSHQEGVVGIQVKPVSDLVTTQELRDSLQEGLLHYIRSDGDTSGYNYTEGPFLIRCEINEKMFYWTVDNFHNVKAEDCRVTEASKFYIKLRSHSEHLNEFYIVYYDSKSKKHANPYVPYYLQRSVTIFDNGSSQPLTFGHYSRDRDTPLALYKAELTQNGGLSATPNRRDRHQSSVSLSTWITEPEACVIQHVRHSFTSPFIVAVEIPNGQAQPDITQQQEEPQEPQELQELLEESQESQQKFRELHLEYQESQKSQERQELESTDHSGYQVS